MSRSHDRDPMWDALAKVGDAPLPGEASDADIVAGALAGLAAPSFLVDQATASTRAAIVTDPAPHPARPALVALVAVITLGAAAALVILVGLPSLHAWQERQRGAGSLAPDVRGDGTDLREASERTPPERNRPRRAVEAAPEPNEPETEEILDPSTSGGESLEAEGDAGEPVHRPVAPPIRSADELLSQAQAQLRDGKTRAAMRTYKRLVDRFPSSREAKAALVSMGRIALQQGRPKQALAHFDAYLAASAGPLVEEARYGRIRALRGLGRSTQELRSIEAFLADHGGSIYAPRLKRRAEELRGEAARGE